MENPHQTLSEPPTSFDVEQQLGLLVDARSSSIAQYKTCPKYIHQNRYSRCKFSVLRTVVDFLKMRYQEKDTKHYTFEEMTEKAGLLHLDAEVKEWLVKEALPHNLKVEVTEGMYYLFKPPLPITGRHSLLRLLRQKYKKGLGGVMLSDVQECVGPRWKKIMRGFKAMQITKTNRFPPTNIKEPRKPKQSAITKAYAGL
uniref:TFIIE beta domain-containing protein n=1 Tax=Scylla olivacea TaxID=85551 RepID=A0A0P4W6Z8_SCYOL